MRPTPEQLKLIAQDIKGSSRDAQRSRVLAALELGGITTVDGIRYLDIIRPAAVVRNLREEGHAIATQWQWDTTEAGKPHLVALYVKESGGEQ